MRGAMLLAVALGFAAGCGKRAEPSGADTPYAMVDTTDKSLREKTGPKVESSELNTDLDSLKIWSETARREIATERKANPIRGDALEKKKLEELQAALAGKAARWRFKVRGIGANGEVGLEAFHYEMRAVKTANSEQLISTQHFLHVRFRKPDRFGGDDFRADPIFVLGSVPKDKLVSLTNGEFVTVTGQIADVSITYSTAFTIDLKDAKIE